MKFFSRQWCDGSLSDEEAESVPAAYRAHVDALLPSMPATVRALADGVNIHDGLLQVIVFDRGRRSLSVMMRCGDLQVGYFDLEIIYYGVRLSADDTGMLRTSRRRLTSRRATTKWTSPVWEVGFIESSSPIIERLR